MTKLKAGRPISTNKALIRSIRLTNDEYAQYKALGSTAWLRELIALHYKIKEATGT